MSNRKRLNIFPGDGAGMPHSPMKSIIQSDLADFMSEIAGIGSVDDAWNRTVEYMRGLGATHIGLSLNLDQPEPLIMWTTPSWVKDLYLQKIFPEADMALEHFKTNVTPHFGGKVIEEHSDLSATRRCYLEEIAVADVGILMAIPVKDNSGHTVGIFDFGLNFGANEFRAYQQEFGSEIYLAAIMACRRIRALLDDPDGSRIELTPSERECLSWLGRGFRNERIADRLGIRPVTVEFHLANARRKLNARTREQALATAVASGLVNP